MATRAEMTRILCALNMGKDAYSQLVAISMHDYGLYIYIQLYSQLATVVILAGYKVL